MLFAISVPSSRQCSWQTGCATPTVASVVATSETSETTACSVLTLTLACRRGSVKTAFSQCPRQQRETSVPQKEMTRQAEITSCGAKLPQKSVRTNGTLRPPVQEGIRWDVKKWNVPPPNVVGARKAQIVHTATRRASSQTGSLWSIARLHIGRHGRLHQHYVTLENVHGRRCVTHARVNKLTCMIVRVERPVCAGNQHVAHLVE